MGFPAICGKRMVLCWCIGVIILSILHQHLQAHILIDGDNNFADSMDAVSAAVDYTKDNFTGIIDDNATALTNDGEINDDEANVENDTAYDISTPSSLTASTRYKEIDTTLYSSDSEDGGVRESGVHKDGNTIHSDAIETHEDREKIDDNVVIVSDDHKEKQVMTETGVENVKEEPTKLELEASGVVEKKNVGKDDGDNVAAKYDFYRYQYTQADNHFYNEFYGLDVEGDTAPLGLKSDKIEDSDEDVDEYHRHHYTPKDYYFFDEFYAISKDKEETDDDVLKKKWIEEMIQKLSDFLEKNKPCALSSFNTSRVNIDDDGDDASDEDTIKTIFGEISKDLDSLIKFDLSCNSTLDQGNRNHDNHISSRENSTVSSHVNSRQDDKSSGSSHSNGSRYNNGNNNTNHNSTAFVSSKPPDTITSHVVHFRPPCWQSFSNHNQNPHINDKGHFKSVELDCEKQCRDAANKRQDKDKDDERNDSRDNDGEDRKMNEDGSNPHRGQDGSDKHKLWESHGATHHCNKDKGPQRPCIDVFSQESVLSQLCTRMNAVEEDNKCVTSHLSANQHTANIWVEKMSQELNELKKTVERLQKSCMFYAEAPMRSSHVGGYKVKLSQGEGFEPSSGVFTAPYDGVYQLTVGYFKRTTSDNDEMINIMTRSSAIFRFRLEGSDQQRIFMTSLESGQSLWLKTNVKLQNDSDVNIDLIFFGAFLMK